MELEQYELAIEEQAYPFEEKAIHVHESNLKLILRGVYNVWIEKSLEKLAKFVPARYDKPEESSDIVSSLDTFIYEIHRPVLASLPVSESGEPAQVEDAGSVVGSEPEKSPRIEESGSVEKFEPGKPSQQDKPESSITGSEPEKAEQIEDAGSAGESKPGDPVQIEKPDSVSSSETAEPDQGGHTGLPATKTDPSTRR